MAPVRCVGYLVRVARVCASPIAPVALSQLDTHRVLAFFLAFTPTALCLSLRMLLLVLSQNADVILPDYNEFTGFVFKLQANLDPRHRDRLAYVRVVSGRYEKGMKARGHFFWHKHLLQNDQHDRVARDERVIRSRYEVEHAMTGSRHPLLIVCIPTMPSCRRKACTKHLTAVVFSSFQDTSCPCFSSFGCVARPRFSSCIVQVQHSRMKGKQVTLAHAQQLFAQERETVLVSVTHETSSVIRLLHDV